VSVFTHENKNIPDIEPKYQSKDSFSISFITNIIEKKLKKLKVTKSARPDGLHPWVLSLISLSLSLSLSLFINLPLSIICTNSYEEGHLPSDWKTAHITPIHKKGSKAIPGNY